MDKTIAYDEPLDPHWERLNASSPSLFQILHTDAGGVSQDDIADLRGIRDDLDARLDEMLQTDKTPGWKRREIMAANLVPFFTRRGRAAEMVENIDRAILDGHLESFPNLDSVKIMFNAFEENAEKLNYYKTKGERAKSGSTPSKRDDLLDIFHRAWVALREFESDGFPLMDYVDSPSLDGPELVGTLRIEKLSDGTIVSVTHEPFPNGAGES